MKGVGILEENKDLLEEDVGLDSGNRIQDVSGRVSQVVDPPGKRLCAVLRRIRSERPRVLS